MKDKDDILNLATEEERDEITELLDKFPNQYFGTGIGWVNTIKKHTI